MKKITEHYNNDTKVHTIVVT